MASVVRQVGKSLVELSGQSREILVDSTRSGRKRPWREHKKNNEILSAAYRDVSLKKAVRLSSCADWLEFSVLEAGVKVLERANFCRVRLCPVCTWRRSLKVQAQVHRIMGAMEADAAKGGKEYAFAYLTLTVRNVKGDELSKTLTAIGSGFQRLMKVKAVNGVVHGYVKSIEVTHNVNRESESFDTYHPHVHVLLAVNKSYFGSRGYINHAAWTEKWKKAMRLDYVPIVDIRKVKGCTAKAVAEAAGYSTKADSFIIPNDWDLTVSSVSVLDKALNKRRFISYGGVIGKYHKKLMMDDPEEGDLLHLDGEDTGEEVAKERRIYYAWFSGYRQYYRVEKEELRNL